MAIFHLDVNIIGRSTGRSAVGSMAYRRSAKMKSIAHAAYQKGAKMYEVGQEIIHDYTNKGGVVHSEILLPKKAPKEFLDSETLWNAVEKRERRKDSQLAREVVVALPREFNLEEQTVVLRQYILENFVDRGMIADFSIHDRGDGNPHAHVMLTMRDVSREGFGAKNFDWNKKSVLLEWRKNWAEINNSALKWLGFDVRIDHRSYKEQGIDREPMVHMGHKAWALEKKGVKTDRGNYNRAVQQRNAEREGVEIVPESSEDEGGEAPPERRKDPREGREAEKTRQVMERLVQQRENAAAARAAEDIADYDRVKKSEQVLGKMQDRQRIVEYLHELSGKRLVSEKGLY
ncbi:MAG: MobA/MobL family protein, partial [Firmicutes bacterium]|nr:MobA/MobL family protein [Bacillota bacterium]